MPTKTPTAIFAKMDKEVAEEEIADWGGLVVTITTNDNGSWNSELSFNTGCRSLDILYHDNEDWLKFQFDAMLEAHQLSDTHNNVFDTIAELYGAAIDNCLFVPQLLERIMFVSRSLSAAANARYGDLNTFCEDFGIPESDTLTVYVICSGRLQATHVCTLVDRETLAANLNPYLRELSPYENYRLQ